MPGRKCSVEGRMVRLWSNCPVSFCEMWRGWPGCSSVTGLCPLACRSILSALTGPARCGISMEIWPKHCRVESGCGAGRGDSPERSRAFTENTPSSGGDSGQSLQSSAHPRQGWTRQTERSHQVRRVREISLEGFIHWSSAHHHCLQTGDYRETLS